MIADMLDTGEMSDQQIVDAIGELRETLKSFKAMEKNLTQALKVRYQNGGAVKGRTYAANIVATKRRQLDTELIRKDMDETWMSIYSKEIVSQRLAINRRPQSGLRQFNAAR